MGITYGDHLIDSGHYDITPEQEREIEAREECSRRGLDPDDDAADGVAVWMVVDKELRERTAPSPLSTGEVEKHTPTPWRVGSGDDYYIAADGYPAEFIGHFKEDDLGPYVAYIGNRPKDFGEANAAYIVKACNAYPEMIVEIERLRAALSQPPATEQIRREVISPNGYGCIKPDTDKQVFFYEQDFYVLSNFSAFTLNWKGWRFDTSEAAYHWEKFAHMNEVGIVGGHECHQCYVIRRAESAHAAFKIAEANKSARRADWDDVKVGIMREILDAKVNQHEYVRRKLLATGQHELIEDSWRDDFWGWGPNRDGQNMLGKLWMEVRAELRALAATEQAREIEAREECKRRGLDPDDYAADGVLVWMVVDQEMREKERPNVGLGWVRTQFPELF